MKKAPLKRLARQNGVPAVAYRSNGHWIINGQRRTPGAALSIVAKDDVTGKWAWHSLNGLTLFYEAPLTEEELLQHNKIYNENKK